jgi:hypothetical protein
MILTLGDCSGKPAIIAEKANGGNEIGANLWKLAVIAGLTRNPSGRATVDAGSSPA